MHEDAYPSTYRRAPPAAPRPAGYFLLHRDAAPAPRLLRLKSPRQQPTNDHNISLHQIQHDTRYITYLHIRSRHPNPSSAPLCLTKTKDKKKKITYPGSLTIVGLKLSTFPSYPVSSLNSLTAASSGDSPSSIRPAGNSTQVAETGGRYCRIMRVEGGLEGCLRIGAIATASTPVFGGGSTVRFHCLFKKGWFFE